MGVKRKSSPSVCVAFAAGCARNKADTALLLAYFRANGWAVNRGMRRADMVIVASCGFDRQIEEYCSRLLSVADKKRSPHSRLVVVGCLASIKRRQIEEVFGATTLGPLELEKLDEIIDATTTLNEVRNLIFTPPGIRRARYCFSHSERLGTAGYPEAALDSIRRYAYFALESLTPEGLLTFMETRFPKALLGRGDYAGESRGDIYRIQIAQGCLGECSYCAIRSAIGPLQSKPMDKIIEKFAAALQKGFREFELVAGDTGAYGQDIGVSICELLERIFRCERTFRVAMADFHPRWLIAYERELTELFESSTRHVRFLGVPVQSGSERILDLMRRGYTASAIGESLSRFRQKCKTVFLSTHIIVGFPTETEEDFEHTVRLLRKVRFDRIDIFRYSDRPGTPAGRMQEKVPEEIIESRVQKLHASLPEDVFIRGRDSIQRGPA